MNKIFTLSLAAILCFLLAGCNQPSLTGMTVTKRPPTQAYPDVNNDQTQYIDDQNTDHQNSTQNNLLIYPNSPTVTYGQVALLGFNLNNSGNKITVRPGEIIPATAMYLYYCPVCQIGSINQIIVGIAGEGAQACLYNGSIEAQGAANFTLKAPQKPGMYQVRFRYAQAYSCQEAIKYWWNVDHAPTAQATVAIITVQ